MVQRTAIVVTHTRLTATSSVVDETVGQLQSRGFNVTIVDTNPQPQFGVTDNQLLDESVEIVVVLGGDGTLLRAAELVKGTKVPIIGINLGHVGFLAEFESFEIPKAIDKVANKDYTIDERMIAQVNVWMPDSEENAPLVDWALNDVTIDHEDHSKMIDVGITVDDVAVSSFGCDGVIISTPTGSTAYAFSAGGPIMWPDVRALELTPVAAHALFARPMVIGSQSTFGVQMLESSPSQGWICCDGRRQIALPRGSRVKIFESDSVLRIARLSDALFTDRLVSKFDLPVVGWREQSHEMYQEKP